MIILFNILPDFNAGLLILSEVLDWLHILVILVLVVLALERGT